MLLHTQRPLVSYDMSQTRVSRHSARLRDTCRQHMARAFHHACICLVESAESWLLLISKPRFLSLFWGGTSD